MCTLSLIPKKKKNTFNGWLLPFHGEGRGEGETNQIWSVEADATEQIVNDFCRRGGGGKIKRARSSGRWYLNGPWLRIRAYETRFGFPEIYTSPLIVFTLLPSRSEIKASRFRSTKVPIVFRPSLPIFRFRFCFCFFLIFVFFFLFFSPFHIPSQYLPWRFAARFASAKSWNNSDYRLMRGSNHFDFESIPDLF